MEPVFDVQDTYKVRNLGKDSQLQNLPMEGEPLVADYLQEQLSPEETESGLAEILHQVAEESVQQLLPDAEEELRLSVAGTLPILRRCHSELFFECGMKMTLAGKAQEFADRTDGFIRVLQKFSSFFQFTAQDKCTD